MQLDSQIRLGNGPGARQAITYQPETLEQIRAGGRLDALLSEHWAEISHFEDIPLAVRWEVYQAAEWAGKLRLFTARHDGELVGYAAYLVGPGPHSGGTIQAIHLALFVTSHYRRGLTGYRLVSYCHDELRKENVQLVYQQSALAHPMDAMLKRLGYERVEVTWAKRLDRK